MRTPVFFDPTGRRSRLAKRSLAILILVIVVGAVLFASTLVSVPKEGDLALPLPQPHAAAIRGTPSRHGLARWLPRRQGSDAHTPLTIGFYVPGDESSLASLRRHLSALDWVAPATVTVAGGTSPRILVDPDPAFARTIAAMPRPPRVVPMVQNYVNGTWDGAGAAKAFESRSARTALAARLATIARVPGNGGLMLDIEALPAAAMPGYLAFVAQLHAMMPRGTSLAVTVPAGDENWSIADFGRAADRVVLMAYDQHWEDGEAGPIAAQDWFVRQVAAARAAVGADRLVVALGSYGYDWHGARTDALSIEEAWLVAHDSAAVPTFDAASGNATFAYDENGERHTIWMMDAATSWNQLVALKRLGIDDVALWRLGSEDPDVWAAMAAFRTGGRPDLSTPRATLETDVEGTGEILRITDTPTAGARAIGFDGAGLIRADRYTALPTPYVVQRTGGSDPKAIALTFDDGPDGTWTPRILDVLEQAHVPATFFVIGENVLRHPGLVSRIVADGSELGNHSYTHPNLANASDASTRLELNATQRVVEAYTRRRMTLFRAPYFGDAEPTTTDELRPALTAQGLGYTVVGLHVDPNDWQRPGADAIVDQVLAQVAAATPSTSGNVVLLHDGGGDRAQTVEALPRIIAALRARGYHFVTASQLVGVPTAAAMPRVSGGDLAAVRVDVAGFVVVAAALFAIGWIFYLAIALGIARALLMTALAWWQGRRDRPVPPEFAPRVSVLIPAYNEERVIASSIVRVLDSDYAALEVVVVDDGSTDGTSAVVTRDFGGDGRVRLLTLPNGGKAAALNRALLHASGEVIIALDADTQFERTTIRRLARWFADPRIGAVAGDARVGNRVNLVTRWQAVEYITAQNLERRALAGFDAMTVVPGAVGAWRRATLDAVGGYPEDTLAEDQDLTIAVQRVGWRVTYDPGAVAWTEAPESLAALAKQRYRWAFGTLQCLWKHRDIWHTRRPRGLALVGMPQAGLFQILFAAVSPIIDLALLISIVGTGLRVVQHGWAQTAGDVGTMGLYWIAFVTIDVLCGWIAYRLDGVRARYPAHLLVAQRFAYRQIMYWVVVRAIAAAIGGWVVGWSKLDRTGRAMSAVPAAE